MDLKTTFCCPSEGLEQKKVTKPQLTSCVQLWVNRRQSACAVTRELASTDPTPKSNCSTAVMDEQNHPPAATTETAQITIWCQNGVCWLQLLRQHLSKFPTMIITQQLTCVRWVFWLLQSHSDVAQPFQAVHQDSWSCLVQSALMLHAKWFGPKILSASGLNYVGQKQAARQQWKAIQPTWGHATETGANPSSEHYS